jgi:hypothetical protein
MLLTYGNIKKSKILKNIYIEDLDDVEYNNQLKKYHQSIENNFYKSFLEFENFLHDSSIEICEKENFVIIHVYAWNNEINESFFFDIVFEKAKILSWNCVKQNGHIARLNKKFSPREFGYEEFYEDNNKRYVSIVCFGNKIKKGIYAPFVTIQFENIKIQKYERYITWFDKKTEKLAGEQKIFVELKKLKKLFPKEIIEDPELIYEYEINRDILKKLCVKMNFDDKNYDYFLSCSKVENT